METGAANTVVCPADGILSAAGSIADGTLLQAKGRQYSLLELLGGDAAWARDFQGGQYATVYLSPRDYHRVHMPVAGRLRRMIHVPGRLFSVSPATTRLVPRLFSRNERVVCLFDSEAGPMAVILVGAIFVASIDTIWAGAVTPGSWFPRVWNYTSGEKQVALERGAEMGRFNMGSTVITMFPRDSVVWRRNLAPQRTVRMGEALGHFTTPA